MGKLIDCSSVETTIYSIASILKVTVEQYLDFTHEMIECGALNEEKNSVYKRYRDRFGVAPSYLKAIWFHGTVSYCSDWFLSDGILPKSRVELKLFEWLKELSCGIESAGVNPWANTYAEKRDVYNEGPFAFLVKDSARFSAYVTDAPELLEELAGSLVKENWRQLIEKYKEKAKPYIVSFEADADEYSLEHAIWYGYLGVKYNNVSAYSFSECTYSASGTPITPKNILRVELVEIA